MKKRQYLGVLCTVSMKGAGLLFAIIFIFQGGGLFAQEEFAVSDSINLYHELETQEEFRGAADLAFRIAGYYAQAGDMPIAMKYYSFARNNAAKAANGILEARALFKQGIMEKMMAESGAYSMEEEQEHFRNAIKNLQRAHVMFKKIGMGGSYEDVMAVLHGGEAQYIIGDYKNAAKALSIALKQSQVKKYNDLGLRASELLTDCYALLGDDEKEAQYKALYDNYQDFFISKTNLDSAREKVEVLQSENKRKQVELELTKSKIENINLQLESQRAKEERNMAIIRQNKLEKKLMIGGLSVIGIFLLVAIVANQYKKRTNKKLAIQNKKILMQKEMIEKRQKELKEEKARTEALLLNILPKPVADELRTNKRVTPRYYKMVTIMFTDFRGFTRIAERMSPGEIVRELDACFMAFDRIIEQYETSVGRKCVEKIKTIGDGYMCAGGVPIANESNPSDVVKVALMIRDYMEKRKLEKMAKKEAFFEIRIGINTGPVVAGVVGKKKFAYDIWGDAVNLASRMESNGEVGRVNISGDTYKYIKDKFLCAYRGKISVKNRGEVDMYFIEGRKRYATGPHSAATEA